MHEILEKICKELDALGASVERTVTSDGALSIATGAWNSPGLNKNELIEVVTSLAEEIRAKDITDLGQMEIRLSDYPPRLSALQTQTVPQLLSQAGQAVSAYLITLSGLRTALEPVLADSDYSNERREILSAIKSIKTKIQNYENHLKELEPRQASLESMVERIERAYDAAEQLPTDLQSLSQAKDKLDNTVRMANEMNENGRIYLEKLGLPIARRLAIATT
jgi:chromosome segregation ATPase